MEKNVVVKKILEALTTGKTKDYTYLTIFFIVFSIFIFFAIRPSLVTAFSLRKEEADLREVDALYERTIETVVSNQAILEEMRDKLPLLSQALPDGPNINKVLNDLQSAASANTVSLTNLSVEEVDLVEAKTKGTRSFAVRAETDADFGKVNQLIRALQNQRRLKNIRMVNVGSETTTGEATPSGSLKIMLEVEGYYL